MRLIFEIIHKIKELFRKLFFNEIDKKKIIENHIRARGYSEQRFKKGTLFIKDFTFCLIEKDIITIGNDVHDNVLKGKGTIIDSENITGLILALRYYDNI